MENWNDLYVELATVLSNDLKDTEQQYADFHRVEGMEQKSPIKWLDLWHNQVNFLEEEHPFPTPAVFFAFRTRGVTDLGEKAQQLNLQVDCYFFYETFSDTYIGSFNQIDALKFIGVLDFIKGRLHGTSGDNFSSMRHIGFNPEDTGNAGNLYKVTFECLVMDESAVKYYDEGAFTGLEIEDNSDFQIP